MNRKLRLFILTSTLLLSACQGQSNVVTSFALSRVSKNMVVGDSFKLEVSKMEGGTAPVTYTSSDPLVATVNEQGTITALKVGEAKITANCGSLQASCLVSVAKKTLNCPVTATKGELSLDLNCPSHNLVGSIASELALYDGGTSKEILLPFGKGEKGRSNVETVKDFFRFAEGEESSVAASYETLLNDPSSDLSEEALHLSSLPPQVFYAFTTKQNQARKFASKDFDLSVLDPLLEVSHLPSFTQENLKALDWPTILDVMATESGMENSTRLKYKTMAMELYIATLNHYEFVSLDQGEAMEYSLSFDNAGLKGISNFLNAHKADFQLKQKITLNDLRVHAVHPKEGNLISSLEVNLGFTEQEISNSIHLVVTLSPDKVPAEDDHFQILEKQLAAWRKA